MFVIQGVNVFPSEIEAALLAVEGTLPHYQVVLSEDSGLDRVEVEIEVTPQTFSDRVGALEGLQSKFAGELQRTLGIAVGVRIVEPHAVDRNQAKVTRVLDKRGARGSH